MLNADRANRTPPSVRSASDKLAAVEQIELFDRRVAQLARELHEAGYLVTLGHEVEADAVARILHTSPRTLKNWRNGVRAKNGFVGPPARICRGRTLYPLGALLEWIGQKNRGGTALDPDGDQAETAVATMAEVEE